MTAEPVPAEGASDRIAWLERRVRRLTGVAVLLVLLALAETAWRFIPPDVVTARSFRVTSPRGVSRAELSAWADGSPMLRLNDRRGEAIGIWALRPDGSLSLRLADAQHMTRLEMLVDPAGAPRFVVFAADGRPSAAILVGEAGEPVLRRFPR